MSRLFSVQLFCVFLFMSSEVSPVFQGWPRPLIRKQLPKATLDLFVANERLFSIFEKLETESLLAENYTQENIFHSDRPTEGIAFAVGEAINVYREFASSLENNIHLVSGVRRLPDDIDRLMNFRWSLKISLEQVGEGSLLPLADWQNIQLYNEEHDVITHGFETSESSIAAARKVVVGRVRNHFLNWAILFRLLSPLKEIILALSVARFFAETTEPTISGELMREHRELVRLWNNWELKILDKENWLSLPFFGNDNF